MCGAPIHLNDAAIRSAFEIDPVARPIGPTEVKHDAGEQVAERTLKSQTQDDGNRAGCREQPLYRQIEDIGDDGKNRGEISEPSKEILKQFAFVGPTLNDDERTQKADDEPRCSKPPGDF